MKTRTRYAAITISDNLEHICKPEECTLATYIFFQVKFEGHIVREYKKYSPTLIPHLVIFEEKYKHIEMVLNKIKHTEYNWQICGDFRLLLLFWANH